jgi:PE-PPE domain
MVSHGCRVLVGISAVAGASVLGLTSMTDPAVAFGADTALILGASGIPTPSPSYVAAAQNLYLDPLGYGGYTPQVVTTPEQFYPLTGPNQLTVDNSIAQGVTALDTSIRPQLAAGNKVVVFAYSQGAGVASQEAANLAASPNPPSPGQLSFVLIGDPSTPNGGILTRFQIPGAPPLSLSSLGVTFSATPTTNTPYPTAVYNQEYDLAGDSPQYPLNILADLNADLGFLTQHLGFLSLTPAQINSAVKLPTTGGNTSYYMIPAANLPLLALVRLIPLVGNPIADLVQPDLRVLINLGYGSITNGWSPDPANVVTPIGLFPTNINPADVLTALANGAVQGVTNALNDLKTPQLLDLSPLSPFLSGLSAIGFTPSATPSLQDLLNAFAIIGNTGSPVTPANFGSQLLSLPKVLADTTTALTANLAQYDAQLFSNQLASGNVLNAAGLPIAADLGVAPFALIFGGIFPVLEAVATTVVQAEQLVGLVPNPLTYPVPAAPAASTTLASTASTKPVTAAVTNTAPTASVANTAPAAPVNTGAPVTSAIKSLTPTGTSAPVNAPVSTAPKASGTPAAPTGGLTTTVTGSGAHTPAASAVTGAGVGGGTRVTGTSGSSGGTHSTASTGLHRAHG